MKICYISDVHTEFYDVGTRNLNKLPRPKGDVLIVAGDLGYLQNGEYNYSAKKYLTSLKEDFSKIYIVPGNHEYYNGDYNNIPYGITEVNDVPDCYVVKDDYVKIGNIFIYMTTLFPILNDDLRLFHSNLNDFNCIYKGDTLIKPSDFDDIHQYSIEHLKSFLDKDEEVYTNKVIVVSHFPPVDEVRKASGRDFRDRYSSYYYNEVRNEGIDFTKIDYWIYGHNHYNPKEDINIDDCIVTCNQLGYIGELYTYKGGKNIEID